jgi:hypothetical protein
MELLSYCRPRHKELSVAKKAWDRAREWAWRIVSDPGGNLLQNLDIKLMTL